jgi:hypothetical protein
MYTTINIKYLLCQCYNICGAVLIFTSNKHFGSPMEIFSKLPIIFSSPPPILNYHHKKGNKIERKKKLLTKTNNRFFIFFILCDIFLYLFLFGFLKHNRSLFYVFSLVSLVPSLQVFFFKKFLSTFIILDINFCL